MVNFLANRFHLIEFGYLVVIAPIILFPRPLSTVLLLGIIALWVLRFSLSGYFIPQTPPNLAILLLLITLLVSQFVSYDLWFGAPKLLGIVWSIAVYFAVVDFIQVSTRYFWFSVIFFTSVGAGLMVLALIGTAWPEKTQISILATSKFPRLIAGVPGAEAGFNANEVAGTLLLFLPLTWAVALASFWRNSTHHNPATWRLIVALGLAIVALLQLALLLLLESRAAILGLALSLLIVLFFLGKAGRLLALGLVALLAMGMFFINKTDFTHGVESILARQLATFDGRMLHWTRGLTAIQLFPVTGLGLNMYRQIPHLLYPQFLIRQGDELTHVHNMYLQVAVDLGLPALVAYLAILILALSLLVQTWKRINDKMFRIVAGGCTVALLSYALFGLLDAVALGARPGVAFWYLLALIVGMHALTISGKDRIDQL